MQLYQGGSQDLQMHAAAPSADDKKMRRAKSTSIIETLAQ
jgi:hypothetical protein